MTCAFPTFILHIALIVVLWLAVGVAGAHLPDANAMALLRKTPWFSWQLEPAIVVPLIILALIYRAGILPAPERRRTRALNAAFFGALFAIFVALESPIDSLAEHSLAIHMVEHMFLRTVAPMLFVLAAPQAALIRGMPDWLRRGLVGPVVGSRRVRRVFGFLSQPLAAAVLFIGVSYFWMIPRFHDLALMNEAVHETWHATLLFSGLIFFWRLFDPRPVPYGSSLAMRLLMIWAAVIGDVLLGFYITLKADVIYPAYEKLGLLWGVSPLHNEMYGGQTIWITGSMMIGVAGIIMVYLWASAEERREGQRLARAAVRANHDAASVQRRNRTLAFGLFGFIAAVLLVFLLAITGFQREQRAIAHTAGGVQVDVQ